MDILKLTNVSDRECDRNRNISQNELEFQHIIVFETDSILLIST
jgi:hypothetical protein